MAGILNSINAGPLSFDPGALMSGVQPFTAGNYVDPQVIAGVLAAMKAKAKAPNGNGVAQSDEHATPPSAQPPLAATAAQPADIAEVQRAYGTGVLGDPNSLAARQGALMQSRDAAAKAQMENINRAADNIRAAITGNVNIPLLMAASAMGQPTHSGRFGEELSNAGLAGGKALQDQRAQALQAAESAGRFDVQGGQIPYDMANTDVDNFYKSAALGENFLQSAGLNDYRTGTNQYRQQMVDYHNRMAATAEAKATPAMIKEAQTLVDSGHAADVGAALLMLKGGYKKDPIKYSNAVSNKMHQLSMTMAGMNLSPTDLEATARAQVAEEMDTYGGSGGAQPSSAAVPTIGMVQKGSDGHQYRFKGGNPHDKKNWEKVGQ